jgi:hypothetical protein
MNGVLFAIFISALCVFASYSERAYGWLTVGLLVLTINVVTYIDQIVRKDSLYNRRKDQNHD